MRCGVKWAPPPPHTHTLGSSLESLKLSQCYFLSLSEARKRPQIVMHSSILTVSEAQWCATRRDLPQGCLSLRHSHRGRACVRRSPGHTVQDRCSDSLPRPMFTRRSAHYSYDRNRNPHSDSLLNTRLESPVRHRFSAFWLRSKCSICSYQLNI